VRSVREWHFNPQLVPPRQFDVVVRYEPEAALSSPSRPLTIRKIDGSMLPLEMQQRVLDPFPYRVGPTVPFEVRDQIVRDSFEHNEGLVVQANPTRDGWLDAANLPGNGVPPIPAGPPPPQPPDPNRTFRVARIDAPGVAESLVGRFGIHLGDMISLAELNNRFGELRLGDNHLTMRANIGRDGMLNIQLGVVNGVPAADRDFRTTVKRIDASALPEPLRSQVLQRLELREGDSATGEEVRMKMSAACAMDEHVDFSAKYKSPDRQSMNVEITFVYKPEGRRQTTQPRAPQPINMVPPEYPLLAKQARVQGTVRFAVTIQPDGTVSNIQLIAGHPLLIPAATEAMKQYRFAPMASEIKAAIDINFVLPH